MSKRQRSLAVLLLVFFLVGAWMGSAAAQSSPKQIVIDVSQHGWNNDPNAIFTVEEGEPVEFVFNYGDGDLSIDNPHVMMIEGTNVESGQLNRANPKQVMRFVPEKTGTFSLQCKITCTGHGNLGSGRIRVVAAGSGGAQPLETAIALVTVPPKAAGELAEVRAKVTTATGAPVEGVTVDFSVRTTFVISEWMPVGQARTGPSGEAVLRFRPNRGGDQTVRAYYAGSGRYVGAEKTLNLAVPEMQPVYNQPDGLHIPGFGFWLLWLIVGVIWATYLLIFFNLRQLRLNR